MVRVNATDKHIAYSGMWYRGEHNTMATVSVNSQFFFTFRGTSITIYGRRWSDTTGSMTLVLENDSTTIPFNGTTSGDGVSPLHHFYKIGDGDYQLRGDLNIKGTDLNITGTALEIGYFEIENSSGDPFDLLSAGPAAQNVPAQAVTVDDSSLEIKYDTVVWTHPSNDVVYYTRSCSYTQIRGSSLSYAFDGVAIWYYGEIGPDWGFFNLSIDGSTPQRLTAKKILRLSQRLIWSNTSLGPGSHNITLTHDDIGSNYTGLDFFRVLPEEGSTSTLLSSFPTTSSQSVASTNLDQTNRVPFAVGLTLGLLALVVGAIGGVCYLYHRRGGMRSGLDTHPVSSYTTPPMRHAELLLQRNGKRPPQPPRPSGIPVDTGDPLMPLTITEFGPPPSYDGPGNDRRVGAAQ